MENQGSNSAVRMLSSNVFIADTGQKKAAGGSGCFFYTLLAECANAIT
jgi:hypothetical protein